jgi:hypothetical protein
LEYYRAAWTARDRDVLTREITSLDSIPGRNQKCLPVTDNATRLPLITASDGDMFRIGLFYDFNDTFSFPVERLREI